MQKHVLVTFVDWTKLMFCDAFTHKRTYGWTDRLASWNSDLEDEAFGKQQFMVPKTNYEVSALLGTFYVSMKRVVEFHSVSGEIQ